MRQRKCGRPRTHTQVSRGWEHVRPRRPCPCEDSRSSVLAGRICELSAFAHDRNIIIQVFRRIDGTLDIEIFILNKGGAMDFSRGVARHLAMAPYRLDRGQRQQVIVLHDRVYYLFMLSR